MTSGGPAVTSGESLRRRLLRRLAGPWGLIALAAITVAGVNATSELLEAHRDGRRLGVWEPWLWELSSAVLNLALAPLIGWAVGRWPPQRRSPLRFALIHALATIPFSLVHVGGMVAIRKLGYWAAGSFYDFSRGAAALELLYEWRKDVLSYVLFAAVYWLFRRRDELAAAEAALRAAHATSGPDKIELKDGAGSVFVAPADIFWLEAAGNYVELHAAGRTHLVRGTLAAFETRLGPHGFVRAHRSRLVNRARIRALRPTPAGDLDIEFDDGRSVQASRRYRAGLETRT